MLLIWWFVIACALSLILPRIGTWCADKDNIFGQVCALTASLGGNVASIASSVLCLMALISGFRR